jgi:hypothetical protein
LLVDSGQRPGGYFDAHHAGEVTGYVFERHRKLTEAERPLFQPCFAGLSHMASEQEVGEWVVQYVAPMATRERSSMDTVAYGNLFIEELIGYPGVVIRYALRRWSRTNKFRPTLHEIIVLCDAELAWIEQVREVLR